MSRKPKILYLAHTPPPVHGVSKICKLVYASRSINIGLETKVIGINLSNNVIGLRKYSPYKVLRFISILCRLLYNLVFYRPKLVYFSIMPLGMGLMKDLLLVIPLKLFRKKIVYHIHNRGIPDYYSRKANKPIYHFVFKDSAVIHLSEQLLKSEFHWAAGKKIRFFTCPNAVHDNFYISQRHNKRLRILFFSNLFMHKGVKTVFESLALIAETNLKFTLVIGGSPTKDFTKYWVGFQENHSELLEYIEIHAECFGQEKRELFRSSDMFIFPSEFSEECMPLVILEAMSAALPIVASDIGAINEMVCDDCNGFLIPPKSPQLLADKLKMIMCDPGLLQSMGEKSREMYLQKFTVDRFEAGMRKILDIESGIKSVDR